MTPPVRFSKLADEAAVMRLAKVNGKFLPPGAMLPNADAFQVTEDDRAEAKERGRATAGLSVWDEALTTVEQATSLWFFPEPVPVDARIRAFGLAVGRVRTVGSEHGRVVEVIADPRPTQEGPGAEGHALIEGLDRAKGTPREPHKLFLDALVRVCVERPAA